MGKKLIIKGADFSANGFVPFWGVGIVIRGNYAFRIINTLSDVEGDVGSDSTLVRVDSDTEINLEPCKGLMFGQNNIDGTIYCNNAESIHVKTKTPLQTANSMFLGISAESINMKYQRFDVSADGKFTFKNAKVDTLNLQGGFPIGTDCFKDAQITGVLDISNAVLKGKLNGTGSNSDINVTCNKLIARNLNIGSSTNMNQMLFNNYSQEIDLSYIDTSSVTHANSAFQGCTMHTLHLNGWDTTNIWSYGGMFLGCQYLTTVYVNDCSESTKSFIKERLADAGYTFVEQKTGVLVKVM